MISQASIHHKSQSTHWSSQQSSKRKQLFDIMKNRSRRINTAAKEKKIISPNNA